jgi:hypothetical protein
MKKFTALLLIFSLMAISCTTMTTQRQKRFESSKERRGAKLIITKKDGQQTKGELITVKPNSLLLLDTEGKDVSVGIADIRVIIIAKKSQFWVGAFSGFLMGGAFGASLGISYAEREKSKPVLLAGYMADWAILGYGLALGAIGALLGGLIGASVGIDKTIQIEGMTDSKIKEALDKLRKKARIRDYK